MGGLGGEGSIWRRFPVLGLQNYVEDRLMRSGCVR